MRTKVTLKWLGKMDACSSGVVYYKTLGETNLLKILERCIEDREFDYANWLLVKCMDYKQSLRYAVYAAESVLYLYENAYHNDNRPRLAIEAVRAVIMSDSEKNRAAADAAAAAAADAAYDAAYAAAWAARDAAAYTDDDYAATAAGYAGYAAADAYHAAARAAYHAASAAAAAYTATDRAARADHMTKILRHGIKIINL